MKIIKLTQNKFSKVDDEDYEYLNQFKWYYGGDGYAVRNIRLGINNRNTELMHRVLSSPKVDYEVDHINRDKLDNQKSNLRNVTHDQNVLNFGTRKDNTSGFRGVFYRVVGNRHWFTKINIKKREIWGGSFFTKIEAALAYDRLVDKYARGFVRPNFVKTKTFKEVIK
jgi:hypothetical protein